jgi:hypothetical protein
MKSRAVSRLLISAGLCLAIFGCAQAALSTEHSNARAVITQASGDLRITNSLNGQAIFQASDLAPGRSVTGDVQIANVGSLVGDLTLAQLDVSDQPGPNGGRLSDAVQLDVRDVTGGSSIPVYIGGLQAVGTRPLGSLRAGHARTYRLTASLADGGAPSSPTNGDNAYAGSRVTVRYVWTATAPAGGGGGGNPVAPVVKLKVNAKKVLKRGVLDVRTTSDIACRVSEYAQLPKVKATKKKGKRKQKKVKPLKTRTRTATLLIPNKAARVRLKVSKKGRRQLKTTLRRKKRVVLRLHVTASPAAGGPATSITKKVVVKRPKAKRKRPR